MYCLVILGIAAACQGDDVVHPDDTNTQLQQTYDNDRYNSILDDIQKGTFESDSYWINSIAVVDNLLQIEVNYSGGCELHEFELIWPDAIIAIFPPEVGVILTHDANNDTCEALITETLEFDLDENSVGLDDDDYAVMKISVVNASDPSQVVSNR